MTYLTQNKWFKNVVEGFKGDRHTYLVFVTAEDL